jgi:hypothetical protein
MLLDILGSHSPQLYQSDGAHPCMILMAILLQSDATTKAYEMTTRMAINRLQSRDNKTLQGKNVDSQCFKFRQLSVILISNVFNSPVCLLLSYYLRIVFFMISISLKLNRTCTHVVRYEHDFFHIFIYIYSSKMISILPFFPYYKYR